LDVDELEVVILLCSVVVNGVVVVVDFVEVVTVMGSSVVAAVLALLAVTPPGRFEFVPVWSGDVVEVRTGAETFVPNIKMSSTPTTFECTLLSAWNMICLTH